MHGSNPLLEWTIKKAISDRSWGPLNYNLLNDEDIKATMTDLESREFMSMLKNRFKWLVNQQKSLSAFYGKVS